MIPEPRGRGLRRRCKNIAVKMPRTRRGRAARRSVVRQEHSQLEATGAEHQRRQLAFHALEAARATDDRVRVGAALRELFERAAGVEGTGTVNAEMPVDLGQIVGRSLR